MSPERNPYYNAELFELDEEDSSLPLIDLSKNVLHFFRSYL